MSVLRDIVHWFGTATGHTVLLGAIIPAIAILAAGVGAGAISRGAVRRMLGQRERESRASAAAALIHAGTVAVKWHAQAPQSREHFESLASAAEVQVRLLPISGASLAADWAVHQLEQMRANSVSFSFQADETLAEYRDRLVTWVHRPGRAKRLFADDLERWRFEAKPSSDGVVAQQQQWAAERAAEQAAPEPAERVTETVAS